MARDDDPGGVPAVDGLAPHLTALSSTLVTSESLESVLQRTATITSQAIPGNDGVSITLTSGTPIVTVPGHPRRAETAAFDGQLAADADERQYGVGQGPCLEAAREGELRVVVDQARDERWPAYAAAVTALGVGSSMSVPLPVRDEVLGSINVYSRRPGAFDDADVEAVVALAACAAATIANTDLYNATVNLARQLDVASSSRARIEMAKGVLMERLGCSADEAFETLRSASQDRNVKLRDIADRVVETRDWPQPD